MSDPIEAPVFGTSGWSSEGGGFLVGQILAVSARGQALVDFPGNPMGPVAARSILAAPPPGCAGKEEDAAVLLAFEHGDLALPIILGIVHDALYAVPPGEEISLSREHLEGVVCDGKKMVLEAREEIVLRCGASSVTLQKDGRIVVKGTHLVSRSSGPNKIKGASVAIN